MQKLNIKSKASELLTCLKNELKTPNADFKLIAIKCATLILPLFLSLIHFSFVFVSLALAGIYILTEKSSRCVYYMVFLLPFLNILRKTPNDLYYSIVLWCLVLLILGVKLFVSIFIKKEKKLNWPLSITILIFLIYITVIGPFNFSNHGALYLTIAICYVLYYYLKDFSFKEIIFVFFIGAVAASIFGLFRPIFEREQSFLPFFLSSGSRFAGISNDPNYFAGDMLMILAGAMVLYDRKQINYLFYVAIVPLTIFAIMSLSKMMILIYAMVMVYFCLYVLIKHRWKQGFLKCVAIGVAFLISCVCCFNQILALTGRLSTGNVGVQEEVVIVVPPQTGSSEEDFSGDKQVQEPVVYEFRNNIFTVLTTGRTNIWLGYLDESFSSVKVALFGHGVGAPFVMCDNGYVFAYHAEHNTFIQMIYRLGIVGILILALAIYFAVNKKSFKGMNFANLTVLIVMLGLFMALCNLLSYRLSIYILILILSLSQRDEALDVEKIGNVEIIIKNEV